MLAPRSTAAATDNPVESVIVPFVIVVSPIVKSVVASIVVATMVDVAVAPIAVPSILPAPISTVANVAVPVVDIFSSPKLIVPPAAVILPSATV